MVSKSESPESSWYSEKQSAYLYAELASKEKGGPGERLFGQLGQEAAKQAELWAQKLPADRRERLHFAPNAKTKLLRLMIRSLGPRALLRPLAAAKIRGLSIYAHLPTGPHHAVPSDPAQMGAHHGTSHAGWLRAAIFGANDGLVSNASLILGFAGAAAEPKTLLLSGTAGLLAGAFSMACGEYISVRTQREYLERQLALEEAELRAYPEEEAEELALIYAARGMSPELAQSAARSVIANPEQALLTLAREELGVDPAELGSPWVAASSSFAAFGLGALVPLLPFALPMPANFPAPLGLSVGLSAAALAGIGAGMSLFTGRSAWYGGLRMLGIGVLGGSLTFAVGSLLG